LGSDFDGVGGKLPNGLKNVSCYPNLIFELMKNGYTEEDIKKICSDNFLRVWSDAERTKMNLIFEISGQAGYMYDSLLNSVDSITVTRPRCHLEP